MSEILPTVISSDVTRKLAAILNIFSSGQWLRRMLIVLLCMLINLRTLAADPSCPDPDVRLPVLLMPPPEQDSALTKAELQELRHLQKLRTPEQVARAMDDDRRTVERFLEGMGVK